MTRLDYYELLGVERTAGHAEIKTAYRRLALRHHPDRNGGDPQAEERFKAISEAYAVLSDPAKRTAYDLSRSGGSASFGYSQQDIFADLLRTMAAGRMGDFGAEFSRSGLRFDEAFLRHVFFGSGPFVVRGFFFAGPSSGAAVFRSARRAPTAPPSVAARLLAPVGRWLLKAAGKAALAVVGFGLRRIERRLVEAQQAQTGGLDLTYRISVSPRQAKEGVDIELTYPRGIRPQRLAVRIPPGTSPGDTLRLDGMGLKRRGRRGDLLLVVDVC